MFKNYKFYSVLLIIFIAILAYTVYDYYQYNENRDKQAFKKGEDKREQTKVILNGVLDTIENVTLNLADKLSKKKHSKNQIEQIIRETAKENGFCVGITVALEPKIINDSVKQLYAPYYSKKNDEVHYIENSYDYTNNSLETAQWYTEVIKQNKGVWSKPYVGQVAQGISY